MTANEPRYYPLLDAFRFLAATAIVWLHISGVPWLERSKDLGRFAVPFFTCAATFLAIDVVRRRPATSVKKYFCDRFGRIYPLFLAWSVIYWLARSVSSKLIKHEGWAKITVRGFLLDGIAVQLWFLPFIIVATTAAFVVGKIVQTVPAAKFLVVLTMIILGIFVGIMPTPAWVQAAGYSPWLSHDTLPACAWGIAFGLLMDRGKTSVNGVAKVEVESLPIQRLRQSPIPTAAGMAVFCLWLISVPYGRCLISENMAGVGLFLLALTWVTSKPVPFLGTLGSISFGIYLIHALFVEGMQNILPKIGVVPSGSRDVAIWLVAMLGSCTLSLLLKRTKRWPAWLVG